MCDFGEEADLSCNLLHHKYNLSNLPEVVICGSGFRLSFSFSRLTNLAWLALQPEDWVDEEWIDDPEDKKPDVSTSYTRRIGILIGSLTSVCIRRHSDILCLVLSYSSTRRPEVM